MAFIQRDLVTIIFRQMFLHINYTPISRKRLGSILLKKANRLKYKTWG